MRTEEEILKLILQVAATNEHVKAVLLTGSRVQPNVVKDQFRDFDVIYIVTQLETFTNNHSWVDVFGDRLIMQLPDEMIIGEKDENMFHYLMLFSDGNRIDLTLFPLNESDELIRKESLFKVLLDKDNSFVNLHYSNKEKYFIQPPTQKEFTDCCNEFWWVSTYVAKGLWRKEIIYVKAMLDGPVRTMFLKLVEWYIGVKTSFKISIGKSGRKLQQYLSPQLYEQILATYPYSNIDNIWNALFLMTSLFNDLAIEVTKDLFLTYNEVEAKHVTSYLKQVYAMPSKNIL